MALIILRRWFLHSRFLTTKVLKSVCEIHVCAKFQVSFCYMKPWIVWQVTSWFTGEGHAKRTRLHDSMRTISDSWYRASDELQCMHGFGTELIRNLAIWLAVSQDYHLFIYKVYWYILSMFVPIFTSFGIENASLHSGRPRKLLPLISLSYFFLFHDPRVSTRGIASIDIKCQLCMLAIPR